MKRVLLIALVAIVVAVPGAIVIKLWPTRAQPAAIRQEPPMKIEPVPGESPAEGPLADFDLRNVTKGSTRIKLWVTPPGTKIPCGVEFVAKDHGVSALVSKHGAAGYTSVTMPESWVDRLNTAIKGTPGGTTTPAAHGAATAKSSETGIPAEIAWEITGEVPRKFQVHFEAQGVGWEILNEIIQHYGLVPYTVKKGDTPAKIAQKLFGDASRSKEIEAANPAMRSDHLVPGEVIKVPKK